MTIPYTKTAPGATTVAANPETAPSTFTRLDDVVRGELVSLWWRLRRHEGIDLPPQRSVILIEGNKA